jgi:hypothetical protein
MFWFIAGLVIGACVGMLLVCVVASGAIQDAHRENAAWSKSCENPANYGKQHN